MRIDCFAGAGAGAGAGATWSSDGGGAGGAAGARLLLESGWICTCRQDVRRQCENEGRGRVGAAAAAAAAADAGLVRPLAERIKPLPPSLTALPLLGTGACARARERCFC